MSIRRRQPSERLCQQHFNTNESKPQTTFSYIFAQTFQRGTVAADPGSSVVMVVVVAIIFGQLLKENVLWVHLLTSHCSFLLLLPHNLNSSRVYQKRFYFYCTFRDMVSLRRPCFCPLRSGPELLCILRSFDQRRVPTS